MCDVRCAMPPPSWLELDLGIIVDGTAKQSPISIPSSCSTRINCSMAQRSTPLQSCQGTIGARWPPQFPSRLHTVLFLLFPCILPAELNVMQLLLSLIHTVLIIFVCTLSLEGPFRSSRRFLLVQRLDWLPLMILYITIGLKSEA